MKTEIKWSNSSLSLLQNCAEAFRRRYLEREYAPPSPKMVRGTAIHKTAALTHHRQLLRQPLPTREEVQDTAATEFSRTWREGVQLTQEEIDTGIRAVRDACKDFAVDVSAFHATDVAPAIHPVGVERRITVQPKNSDLVIHGVIDLIDQTPTGEQIRDLKTGEKAPYTDAAERSQQLTMYSLIRLAEVGTLPERLMLDHLIRTPVKNEKKHVVQSTTRDAHDIAALVNRINTAVAAVEKGLFIPADPTWWGCSRQYCAYYGTCKYVRRGDRPKT